MGGGGGVDLGLPLSGDFLAVGGAALGESFSFSGGLDLGEAFSGGLAVGEATSGGLEVGETESGEAAASGETDAGDFLVGLASAILLAASTRAKAKITVMGKDRADDQSGNRLRSGQQSTYGWKPSF